MPLSQHDQAKIDEFFADIEPFQAAYRFPSFRYLAIRCKGEWILFHGALALNVTEISLAAEFQTPDIRAGEIMLSDIAPSSRKFLHSLTTGQIEILGIQFKFPPAQSNSYGAFYVSFDGARNERAQAGKLIINGANNHSQFVQTPEILRQLRASPLALKSISELALRYKMKFDPASHLYVEVHAPAVGEILETSHLQSKLAHIELYLPGQLGTDKMRLGLRGIMFDGSEADPAPPTLRWRRDEASNDWRSIAEVPFPDGKELACILSYHGIIQQERTLVQPIASQDPLHVVCRAFDPENVAFSEVIDDPTIKKRTGLDLEGSVAAMLSLVGFRVIAADHVPHFEEIPDVVAADKHGNLVLVECTLKLPNAEGKIDKLSRRHQLIRQRLDEVGLGHIRLLAVLAVAQPFDKIAPYVQEAQKAGLLLWGRESLHRLRGWVETRTPESIYDEIASEFSIANLQISYEQTQ